MDKATLNIADYIGSLGVPVSVISRETGIPYDALRRSLRKHNRELRADEFLGICNFLHKGPNDFFEARAPGTPPPPG